jgi:hypothetical protein
MIRRMLSVSSLSAFSSSGIGSIQPIPVRLPNIRPPAASQPSSPAQSAPTGNGAGGMEPTRTLPRGSLLDLSV